MLIIYAHPNKNGHCGYILQQVQKELENKKISFQILDLYQENYNPVLKARCIIIGRALRLTDETKKKIESKVTSALNYVI